jgi:hypothetical protein
MNAPAGIDATAIANIATSAPSVVGYLIVIFPL